MHLLNRDNLYPLLIGELCFILIFFISYNVANSLSYDVSAGLIIFLSAILFPIGALLFVRAADYGAKFFAHLFQVSKFLLVGILNTLVDVGVFNILVAFFGAGTLLVLSIIKIVSFMAAVINSYIFNKTWVFEKKENTESIFGEISSFFTVSVGGLLINIIVFVSSVGILSNLFDLPTVVVSTIAAAVASASSLLWNFLGYKFYVFK